MEAKKRHAEFSAEELDEKKRMLTPAATKRANEHAAKTLRDFLQQKKQNVNFEDFTLEQLDEVLGHFYMGVRTEDNELYRGKSLQALRYGIKRYLNSPPHNKPFNILTHEAFASSNEMFKVAMQELKAEGKGNVRHTPAITKEDLNRLYTSRFMSCDTPSGLANKVQFDVRFYFFRRGQENFEKMTKTTFEVKVDSYGREYIIKRRDELTKNHRERDEDLVSGVMASTGNPDCPVLSFKKYLSKLHPNCDRLWQFPVNNFLPEDEHWFQNKPMGVHTLKAFMTKLSTLCKLSQQYTNHSVRASGATLLADNNFSPLDIISVTGHKTVSSLQPYQKTSTARKIQMAEALSSTLTGKAQLAMPSSSTSKHDHDGCHRRLTASATVTSQTVHQELQLTEEQLAAIFDEEFDNTPVPQKPKQSAPTFNNCNFSNATINFVFNL